MNCYATVSDLKSTISTGKSDAFLLALLESASREIEGPELANRCFWTVIETRIFNGPERDTRFDSMPAYILTGDYLTVNSVEEDEVGDLAYSTAWEAGTWTMGPHGEWPRYLVHVNVFKARRFRPGVGRYRLTGLWGAGDCAGSAWRGSGVTGGIGTASGTTLTLSGAGVVDAGHTLQLEDEQMYVTSVSGTSATVTRGVNGTTAAVHADGTTVNLAAYPSEVWMATLWLTSALLTQMAAAGLSSESVGQYRAAYKDINLELVRRMLGRVRAA